jgi:DNA-directed RNA polymerase beta' subunit
MLAKTQDNVGRSTITVDPELNIDEISIPKDMAYTMYAPYIQSQLKKIGLSDSEALRHVRDRSEMADKALSIVMHQRPVLYSRAPAWHKHSVLAGIPRIHDGDEIRTNPYVAAGLGADYDGNCIIGSSKLVIRVDKNSEAWKQLSANL